MIVGSNIESLWLMKYKIQILMFTSILFWERLYAQDSTKVAGEIISEKSWFMLPWVWITGGIAILLILISLFSGGKRSKNSSRTDRVIITKTIKTETNLDD